MIGLEGIFLLLQAFDKSFLSIDKMIRYEIIKENFKNPRFPPREEGHLKQYYFKNRINNYNHRPRDNLSPRRSDKNEYFKKETN